MKAQLFSGTGTAIVTPFKSDETIDYVALGRLIDRQIEAGIEAIVPCGSTGESATLSTAEKLDIIRFTVERCAGRVPVVAGTGSNNTRATIELSREAAAAGADGLLLVCPYYNRPTQAGIVEHYRRIADAVDLPQVLYNVPSRTAISMRAETQLQLSEECPNIVASKEASADFDLCLEIIRNAPQGFVLYSGDDGITLPLIAGGARGVIAVVANLIPLEFGTMVRNALSDDFSAARDQLLRLLPLIRLMGAESNPIPVKAALHLLQLAGPACRLPMTPAGDDTKQLLRRELQSLGLA